MFLAPSADVRNVVGYLAAFAAKKTGVQLISCTAMSNHYHHTSNDPEGRLGEYLSIFFGLMARVFNNRLDRSGYFWDAQGPAVQKIMLPTDHVREFVYVAGNPVKAHLVPTATQWPGLIITPDMIGQTLIFQRPNDPFFRRESMPDEIELHIHEPSGAEEVYGPGGFAAAVTKDLAELEAEHSPEFPKDSCRSESPSTPTPGFLGAAAVQSTNPFDTAPMPKKTCYLRKIISSKKNVVKYELALRCAFRADYREARKCLLAGGDPVFPAGTYALRRWAGVRVADPPPPPNYHELELLAA